MNTKKIRSCYNLAITRKGELFDIVRYVNGFDNEPVTILRNLNKNEVNAKFNRAIKLIASTVSEHSVIISPMDKNHIVELVLLFEDSGITTSDIKIQNNGTLYFKVSGEDDKSVRDNVESLLRENNIDYDHDMITIARGDAIDIPTKKAELVSMGSIEKREDTYLQTPKYNIDTSISPLTDEEKESLEVLKSYPQLIENPELKQKYNELIAKSATTVQHSPSIDESTVDPINEVSVNTNKAEVFLSNTTSKFNSAEDLINSMLSNGISIEDIKKCYSDKPELFKSVL